MGAQGEDYYLGRRPSFFQSSRDFRIPWRQELVSIISSMYQLSRSKIMTSLFFESLPQLWILMDTSALFSLTIFTLSTWKERSLPQS